MKNYVLNLLRGGVFLLAVIAALAFTQPMNSIIYGTTDNGVTWYDATDLIPNEDYRCDPTGQHCLYNSMDLSDPVTGTADRNFQLITPQTPVGR